MILIYLTCKNKREAIKISGELLKYRLIACAKVIPVLSFYLWKGKLSKDSEVLALFETDDRMFKKIERVVRKLHSYKTFVMFSVAVDKTSKGVRNWIRRELGRDYS